MVTNIIRWLAFHQFYPAFFALTFISGPWAFLGLFAGLLGMNSLFVSLSPEDFSSSILPDLGIQTIPNLGESLALCALGLVTLYLAFGAARVAKHLVELRFGRGAY